MSLLPLYFPLYMNLCRTLWLVEVVHKKDSAGPLEGTCFTSPLTHLPEKSSTSRMPDSGAGCKQLKQPMLSLCCLMKLVYAAGQRRKIITPAPLSPEWGVSAVCSQGSSPRRADNFPFCVIVFSRLLFLHCFWFSCLTGEAHCALFLSWPSQLSFKIQTLGTWCGGNIYNVT